MSGVGQVSKDGSDDFDILEVGTDRGSSKDWKVEARVAGKNIFFKVDTGSQANLLPFLVYRKIGEAGNLTPTSAVL